MRPALPGRGRQCTHSSLEGATVAGTDPLILGLDAGERLHDQSFGAELITEKRRSIARIAVEGGGEIGARAEQRSAIVVAAAADRTEAPAGLVKSLAEGVARAQIADCGVVARLESGEDFGGGSSAKVEASEADISSAPRRQIRAASRVSRRQYACWTRPPKVNPVRAFASIMVHFSIVNQNYNVMASNSTFIQFRVVTPGRAPHAS
jgi:hypothetical protein